MLLVWFEQLGDRVIVNIYNIVFFILRYFLGGLKDFFPVGHRQYYLARLKCKVVEGNIQTISKIVNSGAFPGDNAGRLLGAMLQCAVDQFLLAVISIVYRLPRHACRSRDFTHGGFFHTIVREKLQSRFDDLDISFVHTHLIGSLSEIVNFR